MPSLSRKARWLCIIKPKIKTKQVPRRGHCLSRSTTTLRKNSLVALRTELRPFRFFFFFRNERTRLKKNACIAKYRQPCACQTADRSSRCQGQAQASTVLAGRRKSSTWFASYARRWRSGWRHMAACVKFSRGARGKREDGFDRCADETGRGKRPFARTLTLFSIIGPVCTLETRVRAWRNWTRERNIWHATRKSRHRHGGINSWIRYVERRRDTPPAMAVHEQTCIIFVGTPRRTPIVLIYSFLCLNKFLLLAISMSRPVSITRTLDTTKKGVNKASTRMRNGKFRKNGSRIVKGGNGEMSKCAFLEEMLGKK